MQMLAAKSGRGICLYHLRIIYLFFAATYRSHDQYTEHSVFGIQLHA